MFMTAVPVTKLLAWGEGDSGGHVHGTREEPGTLTQGAPVSQPQVSLTLVRLE